MHDTLVVDEEVFWVKNDTRTKNDTAFRDSYVLLHTVVFPARELDTYDPPA